jgi:hypothetical protein
LFAGRLQLIRARSHLIRAEHTPYSHLIPVENPLVCRQNDLCLQFATPKQPFESSVLEYHFPTLIAAKLAIADDLGRPLTQLSVDEKAFIEQVLGETLMRRLVLSRVRDYFRKKAVGESDAG